MGNSTRGERVNSDLPITLAIIAAFLSVFTVWIYLNRKIDQTSQRIEKVDKSIGESLAAMSKNINENINSIYKSIANLEADVRELRTDVRWIKKMMEEKK